MKTETRDQIETLCKGNFLKNIPKDDMDSLSLTAKMVESCEEYQGIEPKIEQKIQKRHGYG